MKNNRQSIGRSIATLNRLRYFLLKARACCSRCTDNTRTFVYSFSCSSSTVPSYFSRYTWRKKKKRQREEGRRGKAKKSEDKERERERQKCKLKLARLHNSILYAIFSIDNARSCIIHFLLSATNTNKGRGRFMRCAIKYAINFRERKYFSAFSKSPVGELSVLKPQFPVAT